MKCTFSAREPNILMEAQPGDLFVPLGPDLVECVCAMCSVEDRPDASLRIADVWPSNALNPDCKRSVIVLGCRVEKGEPNYRPAGFKFYLRGATPIAFLEQVEPAAFRERGCTSDDSLTEIVKRVFPPLSVPEPPAPVAVCDSNGVPISRL